MANPFKYGAIATGEHFTDRASELAELKADILSGQNVVVISPRRFGKTSLVIKARQELVADGALIAYVDLFKAPDRDRFASLLAAGIHDGLVAPVERVLSKALDIFRRLPLSPRVTINQDGTPSFDFGMSERKIDADQLISALLEIPGRIAADRRRPVAVIFDEFQQIIDIDPALPALIRAAFQMQPEVSHVFLGSRRHLLERVFTRENEPMYRLAKPLPLSRISETDFATFISERFASSGLTITQAAITRILDITDCHPHDTQELCYFTFGVATTDRREVAVETVDEALVRVVEAEDAHYTDLWRRLTLNQRLLLAALSGSRDVTGIFAAEFRRQHRLPAVSSVQRATQTLVDDEFIEQTARDTYRISDSFLREWIRRTWMRP